MNPTWKRLIDKMVLFKFMTDFSNSRIIQNFNRLKIIRIVTVIDVYTYTVYGGGGGGDL